MATATKKTIEIKEFAQRVERLCDFLLSRNDESVIREGSDDFRVIERLKEDAADLMFDNAETVSRALEGLHNYMNGV